ncbi:peptidoglycan recognition protein [Streptomyces sp. NPDC048717]|uniref:peptidoglycan recognition protein family protein n=1 Tax=Streptomyces sp. NPDC048717 TaxID=3154928 RepID=UPI00342AB169
MRASLVSSLAVGCATALALPLSLTAPTPAAAAAPGPRLAPALAPTAPDAPDADVAGSTQSLPLEPLAPDGPRNRAGGRTAAGERGLTRSEVRPFSLVGVVWDDARAPLDGTVQVRSRSTADGTWSPWRDVETHNEEHGADPGTVEDRGAAPRGGTAPLWVGASDGVEVRVRPGQDDRHDRHERAGELPRGLRLELVDPGREPERTTSTRAMGAPADGGGGGVAAPYTHYTGYPGYPGYTGQFTRPYPGGGHTSSGSGQPGKSSQSGKPAKQGQSGKPGKPSRPSQSGQSGPAGESEKAEQAVRKATAAAESAGANAELAPYGVSSIPAQTHAQTVASLHKAPGAKPYIGARPKIVTRKGWGADEGLREGGFSYTKTVKAAFVHHSATGNSYKCGEAASVLRGIYRYHVKSMHWRDIGYNFAVDKCGTIYEGRAGGVAKAVQGAHTMGFNSDSMGIAVLGSYGSTNPPAAAVTAIARLTAWKLGLFEANPKGKTTLTSGGGNRFKKGSKVKLNVISGHRDGFSTECPGKRLYGKLGTARSASAKYQGRS